MDADTDTRVECLRCATKYPSRAPGFLGWAFLEDGDLFVQPERRRVRGRSLPPESTTYLGHEVFGQSPGPNVHLHCNSCGLRPSLRRNGKLQAAVAAGYPRVQVGANGEVRPVGAPRP
jgi:hypothetical protein